MKLYFSSQSKASTGVDKFGYATSTLNVLPPQTQQQQSPKKRRR